MSHSSLELLGSVVEPVWLSRLSSIEMSLSYRLFGIGGSTNNGLLIGMYRGFPMTLIVDDPAPKSVLARFDGPSILLSPLSSRRHFVPETLVPHLAGVSLA